MIAPNAHQQSLSHPTQIWGGDTRTAGRSVTHSHQAHQAHQNSFSKTLEKTNATIPTADTNAVSNTGGTEEEFSFFDFIKGIVDIVNPLQHIPVISTIYRNITGDELSPMARVAGGALFGGPLGAVVSLASAATQQTTGKDLGQTAMALFTGGNDGASDPAVQIASANITTPATATDQKIIWNDEKNINENTHSSSAFNPTSYHTKADENPQPTSLHTYTQASVVKRESRSDTPTDLTAVAENHVGKKSSSAVSVSQRPVLNTQEALDVEEGRMPIAPELIAIQMMEGLDKYAAMKKQSMAPHQIQAMY